MRKIVLVTGASSGIGKAIADLLVEKKHIVYGTSRNPGKYSSISNFPLLNLEVSNKNSIKLLVKKIIDKHSRLDILINNAGTGITGSIEETPDIEIINNFNTNFFGPLTLIKAVLPIMRKNNFGRVINIGSIAGYSGLPFRGIYSASKSSLILVTESLRMELNNFNIKLSTIDPGDVNTNISSRRFHTPLIKKSPYYNTYKRNLNTINSHVSKGKDPKLIAFKVLEVINKKSPKPHYLVGSILEKLSVFLKIFLPQKLYEKLLMLFYKL